MPAKLTVTGFRYQPFPSGGRSTEGETVGGVASYLNAKLAGALVFPAASLHVPETATAAPSPPEYEGLEHDAIPDVASAPATATVSGCRYQAPESAGRDGVMAVTCGGVASRRTVIVLEYTSSGPYDTLQERCSVAVSSVTGRESQLTCVHPGSNCHEIATLERVPTRARRGPRRASWDRSVWCGRPCRRNESQSEQSEQEQDPGPQTMPSLRTRRPAQRTIPPLSVVTRRSTPPEGEKSPVELVDDGERCQRHPAAVVRLCALQGGNPLLLHDRFTSRRLAASASTSPTPRVRPERRRRARSRQPAPSSASRPARYAPARAASESPAAARERRLPGVDLGPASPPARASRARRTAARDLLPERPDAAATTISPVVPFPPDLRAFSRSYCRF